MRGGNALSGVKEHARALNFEDGRRWTGVGPTSTAAVQRCSGAGRGET